MFGFKLNCYRVKIAVRTGNKPALANKYFHNHKSLQLGEEVELKSIFEFIYALISKTMTNKLTTWKLNICSL